MLDADVTILYLLNRYACLVCRHRPTFDTIAMLSVHRSGQKHIRGMNATCTHIYVYICIYVSALHFVFVEAPVLLLIYTSVAAHSLLQRKQEDREEAERRDQLKQLQSGAKQIVCSVTGDLFIEHYQ